MFVFIVNFFFFVLTLSPAIYADGSYNSSEEFFIKDLKDDRFKDIKNLNDIKMPLLYLIVLIIYIRGIQRIEKYYSIFEITLLFLFFRLPEEIYKLIPKLTLFWNLWWFLRIETWCDIWMKFSDKYDLGWTFKIPELSIKNKLVMR